MLKRTENKVKDKYVESGEIVLFEVEFICNFKSREGQEIELMHQKPTKYKHKKINYIWVLSKLNFNGFFQRNTCIK